MKLSMTDSRGKESLTLTMIFFTWLAMTVVFVWKGGPEHIGTYGTGCLAIMLPWLGREAMEKFKKPATA